MLRQAYLNACFPMTVEDGSIGWFRPDRRAMFSIAGMRVSRSLQKRIRRGGFEVRFDTAFEAVMRSCMRPEDNWISEPLIRLYAEAHLEGWAHSVEVWRNGAMVGGSYGLAIGTIFCAESMFHRETDMSKVALWALIERCRALGFTHFDAQIMNPHLASLGAYEVSDREYRRILSRGLVRSTIWSLAFFAGRTP